MAEKMNADERAVITGSEELSVGETSDWAERLFRLFPALQSRNYQLYFYGQLVSLVGTWLQIVAEGWLVLKLTNSPLLIGLVAAAATVPTLLFSLFGGVIVDRFSRKNIIYVTQASSMVLALIYGLLTVFQLITIWEIITLAFLLGIVTAVDSPARQAFVVELVDKKDLSSAIALNSGIFNGARVIGPSIAGFLIALIGSGGAFLVNSVSYIAVLIALSFITIPGIVPKEHPHPLRAIKAGLSYSFRHPIVRTLLLFAGVNSIFGWSYTTILPYIAEHTFHTGAAGLGYLYAASGVGALVATVIVSGFANKVNPLVFILGGNTLFVAAVLLFTLTANIHLAMFFLLFAGMGLLLQFSTMNTTIQHMISDEYRGRVMSIYTIMFLGFAPFGNIEIGFLSEHLGTDAAIRIGAIIVFLFGLLVLFSRGRIQAAYSRYQQAHHS
jgi:MFS family permease